MSRPAAVEGVSLAAIQFKPYRYLPDDHWSADWWAHGYWGVDGDGPFVQRFDVEIDVSFDIEAGEV